MPRSLQLLLCSAWSVRCRAIIFFLRPAVRPLLIVCLIIVIAGYFLGVRQRKERQDAAWKIDRQVQAALGEPVRILFPDSNHCTLLQAVRLLREKVDVPIDVESRLEATAIGPGDLVTAESWSNLTLNESFANFSEYLWREYKYGEDHAEAHNYSDMQGYIQSQSENKEQVQKSIQRGDVENKVHKIGVKMERKEN